jgi:hypothetical protein
MTFIDTSETVIGVEVAQIYGDIQGPPRSGLSGNVESVLTAIGSGQAQVLGQAGTPKAMVAAAFVIRPSTIKRLRNPFPQGARAKQQFLQIVLRLHISFEKVLLAARQVSILNDINPR